MKTMRTLIVAAVLGISLASAAAQNAVEPAAEEDVVVPVPPPADAEDVITNAPEVLVETNDIVTENEPGAVALDPNTGLPVRVAPQFAPPQYIDQAPPPAADPVVPLAPRRTIVVNPQAFQQPQSAPAPAQAPARESEPAIVSNEAPANRGGASELRLNFRNAPIEMVLNYLSDAAGFIIQLDTPVNGRIDVWSNQPVTRQEAVELLSSVLSRKGYAVIRNNRILRITTREEALHSDVPVNVSNDPNTIPKTDEVVTQIIPIRFVEAKQLMTDLSPLVSSRAMIIANEAGNSIIVTDTQSNIRRLLEVINAIDTSAEAVTEVRVFHLQHHDPVEVANMLTSLFAEQGTGNQSPVRFGGGFGGGGFGGGGGGFGGGGGGGGGRFAQLMAAANSNNRIRRRTRVVAVPDQRTSSVAVTAAKELMDQIGDMIAQIDRESPKVGKVSVIRLENADPAHLQQVLQDMFQNANARRGGQTQTSPLMNRSRQGTSGQTTTGGTGFNQGFGGGFGGGGFGGGGFGGGGFRPQ